MIFKFFREKDQEDPFIYTEDQLMARLRFFIGVCLALTLTGIVFVVLYSIIFVTQPLNAMSPIDQKFFELIIPIATFLTGTLSGIMLASKDDKEGRMKALDAANRATPVSPNPSASPAAPRPFSTAPAFGNAPLGGNAMSTAPLFGSAAAFGSAPVLDTKAQVPQAPQPEI